MLLKPGRHAAGAGGVGAERQRHQPGGDRHRRARARSAGDQIGVERVLRHAIGRAHADQAGGELVEIGLADDDGAGRAQPRHRGRIVRRLIAEGRTGRRGRQAGDVDIVLHRDRNAVQRQVPASPAAISARASASTSASARRLMKMAGRRRGRGCGQSCARPSVPALPSRPGARPRSRPCPRGRPLDTVIAAASSWPDTLRHEGAA